MSANEGLKEASPRVSHVWSSVCFLLCAFFLSAGFWLPAGVLSGRAVDWRLVALGMACGVLIALPIWFVRSVDTAGLDFAGRVRTLLLVAAAVVLGVSVGWLAHRVPGFLYWGIVVG